MFTDAIRGLYRERCELVALCYTGWGETSEMVRRAHHDSVRGLVGLT
jgi:hypothetical protein